MAKQILSTSDDNIGACHLTRIYVLEGNIGAGKSTVLNVLRDRGYAVMTEKIQFWEQFLDRYYADPKRWAFTLQISVLQSMVERLNMIDKMGRADLDIKERVVFVERCLESGRIFVELERSLNYLNDDEYAMLSCLYDAYKTPIDFRYYLDTPVDLCAERIKIRGRSYEKDITKEYLQSLERRYDDMKLDKIKSVGRTPDEIADEIVRLTRTHPTTGWTRIQRSIRLQRAYP